MSERSANIAQLFVRIQSHRERAWKAYIGKKHRQALEHIAAVELACIDLARLLRDEEEARQKRPG